MFPSSRFEIHLLDKNDRSSALSLLLHSFFRDEPLAKHLKLEEPVDFANSVLDQAVHQRCSFVAYDLETNQLVGLCLNEIKLRRPNHSNDLSDEKLKFILNLFDYMHDKVNLYNIFQTDSLLHIFIINVDQEYRGHGLASRLILESIQHGQRLHIGGAYAEATNMFSFIPLQRQNFQVYHRLNYRDYDRQRLGDLIDENHCQCQLVARPL